MLNRRQPIERLPSQNRMGVLPPQGRDLAFLRVTRIRLKVAPRKHPSLLHQYAASTTFQTFPEARDDQKIARSPGNLGKKEGHVVAATAALRIKGTETPLLDLPSQSMVVACKLPRELPCTPALYVECR